MRKRISKLKSRNERKQVRSGSQEAGEEKAGRPEGEGRRVGRAGHDEAEAHKLILSEPNNSHHWLKLAALTLDNQSLEAARKVFERAFQVVSFSNYAERDNLWKALMNLEFHFGDLESLKETVSRAANSRVAAEMLGHALSLYTVSHRFGEGEWLLPLLLRKGERKEDSWLRTVEYLLDWRATEKGDAERQLRDRVRETNKRALQSLDRRDHVAYLSRYAVLEYRRDGAAEGRAQFENLLAAFPKRADLWSVYLDMEAKHGADPGHLRALFEKATRLSLRPNAMKLLFKKFLEFERRSGTPAGEKRVRRAAADYVSKLASK